MPAQTFQTSRDWIRRNVDDEKDGSAICLTFPPYAKYMIPKIKTEAGLLKVNQMLCLFEML